MKIAMKQLFYTIGEPPAVVLSLLPAPQQAIMALNYDSAMAELYGKEGKSLGASGELGHGAGNGIGDKGSDWGATDDATDYGDMVVDLEDDSDSDPYDDSYDDLDEDCY